ncbi:Tctex-1 [Cinara cedri]|uniref:Tctex-1 n=1 Tax=Cinara cedri TaxID=506608 RepID=A0A5E4NT33_9HEMI|nr:Tctex-1 [Cinara cedri]
MSMNFEGKNEEKLDNSNQSLTQNFQIRPTQNQKFKTNLAKEVIQETLHKYLKDKEFCQIQCETLTKTIATEVKDKLKGECIENRYKLMVQVILGERRGAGIKIGSRCVWDADTDSLAFDQFLNETIFCMTVAFVVYFY